MIPIAKPYYRVLQNDTDIDARFIRIATGEILAHIRAEKHNPQAGVSGWEQQLMFLSKEPKRGFLLRTKLPGIEKIDRRYRNAENNWAPVATTSPVVFTWNQKIQAAIGAKPPKSWKDFTEPVFKDNTALT